MTQEEILEGNRLIARFMNFKYKNQTKYWAKYPLDDNSYLYKLGYVRIDNLKFHASWDWLIPALYKLSESKSLLILFYPTDILKTFDLCVKKIKMRNEALKQLNENSIN